MMRPALAYPARIGFSVHPISANKTPLSPHGFKDATKDEAQIRRWWTATPDANIGTVCDWFFVVDVDPRNGGHHTIEQWRRQYGEFPTTWEAVTGSGGLHVYFEHDAVLDSIPLGELKGTGVDIKGGARGYVLLPPSVSKSGPYRWRVRPTECELARAPQWLLDLIVTTKRKPERKTEPVDTTKYKDVDRVQRARSYASKVPGAVEDKGGHLATIRAACMIVRGFALSRDEGVSVMLEWNQTCKPPWSRGDIERKVDQTLDEGDAPMGFLLERGRRAA